MSLVPQTQLSPSCDPEVLVGEKTKDNLTKINPLVDTERVEVECYTTKKKAGCCSMESYTHMVE